MKKAIVLSFFFTILFSVASIANKVIAKPSLIADYGKYIYFRVYTSDNETYYFSNVFWVEGESVTEYSRELEAKKNQFKKILKNDYNIDWTAPVSNYEDSDKGRVIEDRKTRIKYAGENWKSIDLY